MVRAGSMVWLICSVCVCVCVFVCVCVSCVYFYLCVLCFVCTGRYRCRQDSIEKKKKDSIENKNVNVFIFYTILSVFIFYTILSTISLSDPRWRLKRVLG